MNFETITSLPWVELAGVASLFIIAFERVARLTPTTADDKVVQFVRKAAKVLSIDVPDRQ
jgi:hypothetical protein